MTKIYLTQIIITLWTNNQITLSGVDDFFSTRKYWIEASKTSEGFRRVKLNFFVWLGIFQLVKQLIGHYKKHKLTPKILSKLY